MCSLYFCIPLCFCLSFFVLFFFFVNLSSASHLSLSTVIDDRLFLLVMLLLVIANNKLHQFLLIFFACYIFCHSPWFLWLLSSTWLTLTIYWLLYLKIIWRTRMRHRTFMPSSRESVMGWMGWSVSAKILDAKILTPSISEYELTWKQGHCRCN